jgi:hypothetical protein
MMHTCWLPWAEGATRTTFEWGRIQSNADWILPITACIAVLLFVRYLYRRDAVELHPVLGWFLSLLRMAAFFGLLVFYLQPQWRSQREEVRNSRALLLVDTSLSMGLSDDHAASAGGLTRQQQVVKGLGESDFLARLRKTHDVAVFQFAEGLKHDRVVSLEKLESTASEGSPLRAPTEGQSGAEPVDWAKLLAPTGTETRLGQALRQLIQEERGTPVSGIIVLSDGGQNAGVSPDAAVELAQEAKIPVFTVGLGSDRQPTSVAVCDWVVPARAYPGDHYSVTGYVRAQGMAGKQVTVQVLSRPGGDAADAAKQGTGQVVESRQITLGGDGEVVPVKFELIPEEPGRRTLCFRVQSPEADRNPADKLREADIEIVDRKNRVLLLAGGPTREYQFLRSLLYRDRSTTVDVLLQSGKAGLSQEARKILDEFPATREEMYDYDCIVAFDPDWRALGAAQIGLLEKWVSEQGGGLIVVAGPVFAGKGIDGWTHNPAMTAIRNLYPVEFFGRLAALDDNTYAGREPWPLDMTREGREADFLWLGDTATASRQAWAGFSGVYSYCPVRGPKPGATVYARLSDPTTSQGGLQPVYFAGQFYGSGSVFYLGSGEMWRLRAADPAYFDQFYTKLIRHVSQGRLLRGSTRGVLLVGQDHYLLGNTVEVRAQLSNARLDPLEVPGVGLQVIQPGGAVETVAMRPDPTRAGAYFGQFPVLQEGTYRLELPVPESEKERLGRRIQVMVPDLERENPRRNDALLSAIAKNTGGRYYIGMEAAIDAGATDPLVVQLKDRTSTTIVPIAPNRHRDEVWLRWLMSGLCGVLCLEWLIRRLAKLA